MCFDETFSRWGSFDHRVVIALECNCTFGGLSFQEVRDTGSVCKIVQGVTLSSREGTVMIFRVFP